MFSRMQLLADTKAIAARFDIHHLHNREQFVPNAEISGFDHPVHPIIASNDHQLICSDSRWGLVPPDWKKNPEDIWDHTISAKLEYLNKRYAWQKVSDNRCLVPVTAYFEYHWNDPKGKSKTKYIIRNSNNELFALAGLFSLWRKPDGVILQTFAICTTVANEIMEFVHNKDAAKNYHRMPIMLNRNDEMTWLDKSIPYMDFAFPNYRPTLEATPLGPELPRQQTLFSD